MVLLDTLGVCGSQNMLFLSCPHLRLIIRLIHNLLVSCVEILMEQGKESLYETTAEANGEDLDPLKHV